jgi:hypothetical protein
MTNDPMAGMPRWLRVIADRYVLGSFLILLVVIFLGPVFLAVLSSQAAVILILVAWGLIIGFALRAASRR